MRELFASESFLLHCFSLLRFCVLFSIHSIRYLLRNLLKFKISIHNGFHISISSKGIEMKTTLKVQSLSSFNSFLVSARPLARSTSAYFHFVGKFVCTEKHLRVCLCVRVYLLILVVHCCLCLSPFRSPLDFVLNVHTPL